MDLAYYDFIRAIQTGASFAIDRASGAAMDSEFYVAVDLTRPRRDVVEHGVQARPTHLLWRGYRATSGLRDLMVLRRIGRDTP